MKEQAMWRDIIHDAQYVSRYIFTFAHVYSYICWQIKRVSRLGWPRLLVNKRIEEKVE